MKQLIPRVLLAALLCFCLPVVAQEPSQAEQQAKLKELESSIAELKSRLESVRSERDGLQEQLQENETEISELLKKIDEIKKELGREEARLKDLNTQRSLLISDQREQKKQIAQQVKAAYRLGGQSNIKLLLNQDDPANVSRVLRYYDYFLEARQEKISGYQQVIADLNRIEPEIIRNTESLKANRANLQARHQQLKDTQTERARTLARLNQSIENQDQKLQKLAQDRQRVEQVLKQITQVVGTRGFVSDGQPFSKLRGKLPWPAPGKISQGFGSDRVRGKLKWDGVLIAANEGAPVKAIHEGRVVFADYLRGQGLLVIVDHGDGFMSLYAHNQTLTKKVGSRVEAGEVIATVGNSGGQSNAGLYFEIRQNGKPVNPSRWCG